MQRVFSILITLGVIIWVFLLLERAQPVKEAQTLAGETDNAETSDRCAEYRTTSDEDGSIWSLGYAGRVRQLVHGCY